MDRNSEEAKHATNTDTIRHPRKKARISPSLGPVLRSMSSNLNEDDQSESMKAVISVTNSVPDSWKNRFDQDYDKMTTNTGPYVEVYVGEEHPFR